MTSTAETEIHAKAHHAVMRGTGIMMLGILGSRIAGLFRERVIAHQFGQGFATDTYSGSFTIPDLIFYLIAGGALSSAFIPVFSEYITQSNEREAWRTFSVVATVMTMILVVLIGLGEIFAHSLVMLTNPGFALIPGKIDATVSLTRILLPAQLFFFLGGLMMGSLTARHKFFGQATGPIIYNIGIICGGLFLTARYGVAGLCYGAVLGAFLGNFLLQWVLVRRSGGYFLLPPLKPTMSWLSARVKGSREVLPAKLQEYWKHPGAAKVWRLMLPVILGLALPPVSTIINKIFASTLGNGPQTALMNANKLMNIPIAIFGQASAIAIFPLMSAQAAKKDMPGLRRSINFGVRSILFLTVPASMLLFVLALPIVQMMLETGKFNLADAQLAAAVLRCFSLGVCAWSAQAVVARGYYAMQDTRTPVIVGTAITAVFFLSNLLFIHFIGHQHIVRATAGLALLTSCSATILMLVLLLMLNRRLNGINMKRLTLSAVRVFVASTVMAICCVVLKQHINGYFPLLNVASPSQSVFISALELILICIGVSIGVYLSVARLIKMEEMEVLYPIVGRMQTTAIKTLNASYVTVSKLLNRIVFRGTK